MVGVDLKVKNKGQKMSREQSEEEVDVVETEVGPVDDETVKLRWIFVRLVGLTGCRMIGQSSREPLEQRRTSVIRDRQSDSGPSAGPNRNGPGLSCRFRELRDHVGCCRDTAGRVRDRPVLI